MTGRRFLIFLICIVVLVVWQTDALGQPPPGGGPPGDPGGDPDVPITGLEWLIGGGVAYGVRSLLKLRKKQGD